MMFVHDSIGSHGYISSWFDDVISVGQPGYGYCTFVDCARARLSWWTPMSSKEGPARDLLALVFVRVFSLGSWFAAHAGGGFWWFEFC